LEPDTPIQTKSELNATIAVPDPPRRKRKLLDEEEGNKKSEDDPNEQLTAYLRKLDERDWKTRYETIHSVSYYTVKNKERIISAGKTGLVFDCFTKGMGDANMKVNIHSLSAMLKIIPIFKT
jgi:hypothetical protein